MNEMNVTETKDTTSAKTGSVSINDETRRPEFAMADLSSISQKSETISTWDAIAEEIRRDVVKVIDDSPHKVEAIIARGLKLDLDLQSRSTAAGEQSYLGIAEDTNQSDSVIAQR